jgi:hypothetical protein
MSTSSASTCRASTSEHKIVSEGVVIAGRWWHPTFSPEAKG